MRPVVLVTCDRRVPDPPAPGARVRPPMAEVWIAEAYVQAVHAAGGIPLLVPPNPAPVDTLLGLASAVVLTGGHFDIHPHHYGATVDARLDRVEPARTEIEIGLARACLDRGVPILGVCGGMQALAVADGGTLVQDVPKEPLDHEQPTDPARPWHPIHVRGAGRQWLQAVEQVNSTHHQAVDRAGSRFQVIATAPDGTVEAMAAPDHPFAVGIQWHPELLGDLRLYEALIRAARDHFTSSGSHVPTGP